MKLIATLVLSMFLCGCGWVISGYATTTGRNYNSVWFTPRALRDATKHLDTYKTVLFDHDSARPIGKVLLAKWDGEGIVVRIRISKTEPKIWKLIREGVLRKFSIGWQPLEWETEYDFITGSPIRIVLRMVIFEVSLVSVPADPDAEIF